MPMTEGERGDYWHASYNKLQDKYGKVVEENQRLKGSQITDESYYVIDIVGFAPNDIEAVAVGPFSTENERDDTAAKLGKMLGRHALDKGITSLLTATINERGILQVGTYLPSEVDKWFAAPGVTPNSEGD